MPGVVILFGHLMERSDKNVFERARKSVPPFFQSEKIFKWKLIEKHVNNIRVYKMESDNFYEQSHFLEKI